MARLPAVLCASALLLLALSPSSLDGRADPLDNVAAALNCLLAGDVAACVSALCIWDGSWSYVAGTTVVARNVNGTQVDEGLLVCTPEPTVGGAFVPFTAGDTVTVTDGLLGSQVAFQVCIDNDGDLDCHAESGNSTCPDQVFFSHFDSGGFANPLGPLPTGFLPGCPGGYPGYVVFLCQGEHFVGGLPHLHTPTAGNVTASTSSGTLQSGEFCGLPAPPSSPPHTGPGAKRYLA